MAREQAQVAFQNGTKKWRYKGVSADGRTKQKGVIEAQTRDQAIDRVNKLGLIPTELVDVNAGTGLNTNIEIKAFEKYPSKKDFAVMSRQLATMVAAGVSLIRALNIVTEQIGNVKLRNAVRDCMQQVEAGSSFSEAMDNNPDHLFPPIMTNMVRAGETGGFLDKSLITVADSFEADVRLQGQIKGALAYPVVVLGIAVLLVGVMLLTIVPCSTACMRRWARNCHGSRRSWLIWQGRTGWHSRDHCVRGGVRHVLEAQSQQRHHSYLVGSVHVEGARVRQTDHQCGIGAILQQFRIHARFGRAHSAGS